MLGGFHYLSFAGILSCRMSVFNDLRGFSGKRKTQLLCAPSRSTPASESGRRGKHGGSAMEFCENTIWRCS
jgi:hypothetical protein